MKKILLNNAKPLFFYLIVIGVVFLQMPLSGAFPGHLDTWANLAMFNDLKNHILSLIHRQTIGSSIYPCQHVWVLFGLDFFSGVIFLFYKIFGVSDIWAYYFYITTIYSLNSFSVYKFCRLYSSSKLAALFAGLFFSISNFMLGNIDNPNIVLCFPGILSIYFLVSSIRNNQGNKIAWSVIFLSIQLLLAPITFVMLFTLWFVYVAWHGKAVWQLVTRSKRFFLISLLIFSISLTPYFVYYVISAVPVANYNQLRPIQYAPNLSMNLDDFLRTLPNNLLFRDKSDQIPLLRCGYFGIALFLTAILSALSKQRKRFPVFITVAGIIACLGPYVSISNHAIFPSPLKLVYDFLPVSDYFRIPARAFLIGLLGLTVLSSIGMQWLLEQKGITTRVLFAFIPVIYLLENLPFPIKKYPVADKMKLAEYQQKIISPLKINTVLNLPSSLFTGQDSREYIYMYEQTLHKKNTINGSLAYFPSLRLRNDSLCKNAQQPEVLKEIIRSNSVDLIIFHTDLAQADEMKILQTLENAPFLSLVDSNSARKIFTIVEPKL
jgi:hypothetical protein